MSFAQIDLTSLSHWHIVVLIAVLFLALQLLLCLQFTARVGRHRRMLRSMLRDLDQGGDGRLPDPHIEFPFAWLEWIDRIFPDGRDPVGSYNRDDVLKELDTRVASNPSYLLLQRLGVAAPLLGVILTVVGFGWLKLPDESESLDGVLFAVTPLVAGVGAGAVLAFINQFLLHAAGTQVEGLRLDARNWFDAAIWRFQSADTAPAMAGKGAGAFDALVDSMASSADVHRQSTDQLAAAATAIEAAGMSLQESVASFGQRSSDLALSLSSLKSTVAATAVALEKLIPVGERAMAGLDVAVSAFRTSIEDDFSQAATLHRSIATGVNDSVVQLGETTQQLRAESAQFGEVVQRQHESLHAVNESIQQRLFPTQEALTTTVGRLMEQLDGFRTSVDGLTHSVNTFSQDFGRMTGRLEPAVGAFSAAVNGPLTDASNQQETNAQRLAESVEQVRSGVGALGESAGLIRNLLEQQLAQQQQVVPVQESIANAHQNVAAFAQTLEEVTHEIAAARHAMHEGTVEFAESVNQLAEFAGKLTTAASQIEQLDDGARRPTPSNGGGQDSRRLNRQVEQLTGALSRAESAANSMADLPERIQDVLDGFDSNSDAAAGRGAFRSWFQARSSAADSTRRKAR
ncbi:MAG: hypothetical protein R3C10_11250 [Pirellulales bacterium]